MAKPLTITLFADRLDCELSADLAQAEAYSITVNGADFTLTDGAYVLRVTIAGATLVTGAVTVTSGVGTGICDLDVAGLNALFSLPSVRTVTVALVLWHQAAKHLLCQSTVAIHRNEAANIT